MSLVKWLRKNNKKLMAIFVIGTMVSFLGVGEFLNFLTRRQAKQTLYTFGHDQKITNYTLTQARQELEILQALKAQQFLQSTDLRGLFLSELLFSERSPNPALLNYLNQVIQRNGLRITPGQISGMYQGSRVSDIYWILLKAEAIEAGMGIPKRDVGLLMNDIIQELFTDVTYAQLINGVRQQFGMSEDEILGVYGNLLNILQYARLVCGLKDVTYPQMKHIASANQETLETEFVKLNAQDFLKLQDPNAVPDDAALTAHFDQYKSHPAGQIAEDNPFGFGYRLPDRVQIEYLMIRLEDVQKTIPEPTEAALEEYYQRMADTAFTVEVPKDPNDPNSPTDTMIRPYAEVATEVRQRLTVEKTRQESEAILQYARTLAQLSLSEEEAEELTPDEIKDQAVAYSSVADQLKTQYDVNIPVYTGFSGLMSSEDMQADRYLMRLNVAGQGNTQIPLAKVLFTIDPYTSDDPALLTVAKPRLYNTVGPARTTVRPDATSVAGHTMALVRIVAVAPATEPEDITFAYDNTGVRLNEADTDDSPQHVVIKDQVIADVKTLRTFHDLAEKAEELIDMVQADNWQTALTEFNQTYGDKIKQSPTDPNIFTVQTRSLQKAPADQIQQFMDMAQDNPLYGDYVRRIYAENELANRLYAMIPPDQNALSDVPLALNSEPDFSVYCLKHVSVSRLFLPQFDQEKIQYMEQQSQIASQSLAPIHFNPDNILTRMNFQSVNDEPEDSPDIEKAGRP